MSLSFKETLFALEQSIAKGSEFIAKSQILVKKKLLPSSFTKSRPDN